VSEAAGVNFSAHVPGLPGSVATGETQEQVLQHILEAIALHLEDLAADAQPLPDHRTVATVLV
jgi:predicted RNase H-like HicB family nuclease